MIDDDEHFIDFDDIWCGYDLKQFLVFVLMN